MKDLVYLCYLIIGVLVLQCNAKEQKKFPDDFQFGVATAAYQIEGAWNADDKGESIWDHMTHTKPYFIKDQSNGDVASDSYHNYKRDVEMLRELGVDSYRFSISWSRILPNGFSNKISKKGVEFYNNYINEMLKYNIVPMVTLYHWDLPQKLQDLGGLMNPLFADWFEDYARVAYEQFGDRVKFWITVNEPKELCHEGYERTSKAPFLNMTDVGMYYCTKNILIGHARAYRAYAKDYKPTQGGVCGITISMSWFSPLNDTEEDRYATKVRTQAEWGLFADPIFSKDGGFPKELENIVAEKSAAQGYPRSRLPPLTEQERDLVRGTSDFFGINHYTSHFVSATQHKDPTVLVPSLVGDIDNGVYWPPEWPQSVSYWLKQAPNSVYNVLTDLRKKYNDPIFYITENGWSTLATLEDDERIRYFRATWDSMLDALEAGVNLKGYMAWSLMDNFEWNEGYTEVFGLYAVDFKDPNRTRTPKKSAFVYKHLIKTRAVDHDYEPKNRTMWIDEGH